MEEKNTDVLIIGGGPAGSTAALYLARYARDVIVLSKDYGLCGTAGTIENWPGIPEIGGIELFQKIQEHAKSFGAEFIMKDVIKLEKTEKGFRTEANDLIINSKALIFANGTQHRKLEIPGENELIGKGVSYCATCDGMFFKEKEAVVIGGADSAAKAALYLSDIAKKVTIIYRKEKLRCEPIYIKRIEEKENIEVIFNAIPLEILGNTKVEGIKIKQSEEENIIHSDGVFIEVGSAPCTKLTSQLEIDLTESCYIKVDCSMKTNIPGIFAAGDITATPLRQVITAAGDGATAANSAHEYLQKLE